LQHVRTCGGDDAALPSWSSDDDDGGVDALHPPLPLSCAACDASPSWLPCDDRPYRRTTPRTHEPDAYADEGCVEDCVDVAVLPSQLSLHELCGAAWRHASAGVAVCEPRWPLSLLRVCDDDDGAWCASWLDDDGDGDELLWKSWCSCPHVQRWRGYRDRM
jgi:hypothetical protein